MSGILYSRCSFSRESRRGFESVQRRYSIDVNPTEPCVFPEGSDITMGDVENGGKNGHKVGPVSHRSGLTLYWWHLLSFALFLTTVSVGFSTTRLWIRPLSIPACQSEIVALNNVSEEKSLPAASTIPSWSFSLASVPSTKVEISNQNLIGNGGFNLVENLYFHNGTFLLIGDPADFELEKLAGERSGEIDVNQIQVLKLSEAAAAFEGRAIIEMPGTSFILFEVRQRKRCNFMNHYYHFMEYMQGINYLYQTVVRPDPVRMVLFPDCENVLWVGRAPQRLNQLILRVLFPNAVLVGAPFLDSFPNQILHFKKVASADRAGAHTTKAVGMVKKMVADILPNISQSGSIALLRKQLASSFGISPSNIDRPLVCYINRTRTSRRLDQESEARLLGAMTNVPDFNFQDLMMEEYTFLKQFELVYQCNVLLGVHGNGLTHSLWLPDNSTVIEIFPEGWFTLDYEYIAIARGVPYYGYDATLGLIPLEDRRKNTPRGFGKPHPFSLRNVNDIKNLVLKVIKE